jgi:hypothetical protein
MKLGWTSGCSPEQTQIIRSDFKGSIYIRKRLESILRDKIVSASTFTRKKENYALASWPYLQADAVGYERALLEVISLISDEISE